MTSQLAEPTEELREDWPALSHAERLKRFREMHTGEKADFFLELSAHDQAMSSGTAGATARLDASAGTG